MAPCANLKTSTPNVSRQVALTDTGQSPDVSVILLEQSASAPIVISDDFISKIEEALLAHCRRVPSSSTARLEETFVKETNYTSGASSSKKCDRIQDPEEVEDQLFKGKTGTCNDRTERPEHKRDAETHESIGRSSEVASPSSSWGSARAQYYYSKLLATLQILQNKEETVRVQAESLAVAEARIAFLTARSLELKKEIEKKGRELKTLREAVQESRIEKYDVSSTAQIHEFDNQKNIVTTLQNDLSVIEDLYRECFYETAKQEGLIEMLRKSYLDVRLMDKEKSDQISRLYNVINTQKWSLDKCQDIASEVDNLKVEISNFLNCSNNDSGVWEGSLAEGLTEDLQDIASQLLRLRELLAGDCTCGLEEENTRLRKNNEDLMMQVDNLRQKVVDLESLLENKDSVDRQYQQQITEKENELHSIRQQLAAVESDTIERGQTLETVKIQLQQSQVLLKNKTAELERLQKQCEVHEKAIRQQREELDQSREIRKEMQVDNLRQKIVDLENLLENKDSVDRQYQQQIIEKENELHSIRQQLAAVESDTIERGQTLETVKIQLQQTQVLLKDKTAEIERLQRKCELHEKAIRQQREELDQSRELSNEYSALRGSTCAAQRRVRTLRAELTKAMQHCAHLDACHRAEVAALEGALREAQARGAALCAEARRAAQRVRRWTCSRKQLHREQEDIIKQKESQIRLLQRRLEKRNDTTLTRESENETCIRCVSPRSMNSFQNNIKIKTNDERNARSEEPSCSKCPIEGSITSNSSRARRRREIAFETSASERGSSSPVPPQRFSLMKRFFCENRLFSSTREASAQRPERCDATTTSDRDLDYDYDCDCGPCGACRRDHVTTRPSAGSVSASVEELVSRVERAGHALRDSQRRWTRRPTLHTT